VTYALPAETVDDPLTALAEQTGSASHRDPNPLHRPPNAGECP